MDLNTKWMMKKLHRMLSDPGWIRFQLQSRLNPKGLFRRAGRLAGSVGIRRLYLVLSFDCDTDEDIAAAWDVHRRVRDLGIRPVYAVPGELLLKGQEVYRRIAATGAEFINHGFTQHTFRAPGSDDYQSCFFYDRLPLETVREDIIRGDQALKKVLGIQPAGFRAPHFGTFQGRDQLRHLHAVLKELGYSYSTSTEPYYGFRFGPVFSHIGLTEFPVSGSWTKPLAILDSWGCYRAPGREMTGEDYRREGTAVAKYLSQTGSPGILNYYVDPSHIAGEETFFKTAAAWVRAAKSVTYRELLEDLDHAAT